MTTIGTCPRCSEAVLETDRHEITAMVTVRGIDRRPVHWECAARAVLGSVGHQQGRCGCYGGTEEDPPGMTRREAARAALALAMNIGQGTDGRVAR